MDLTTAQTHLSDALAQLTKARNAHQVSDGDRSITRQRITDLQKDVAYWQRTVNTLTANAGGNATPGIKIATWNY